MRGAFSTAACAHFSLFICIFFFFSLFGAFFFFGFFLTDFRLLVV